MAPSESSRDRLLHAGKHLFATRGYENSSTIAIARDAGTSESQLMKHFGSKDGLLEAIFEHGWQQMGAHLEAVRQMPDPLEKLRALLYGTMEALGRDPEMKELMLLESRRVRKQGNQILLTAGFIDFMKLVDSVLRDMRNRGQLRPELKPEALRSAIIGMTEGMMRDELLSQRMGYTSPFNASDMRDVMTVLIPALVNHPEGIAPAAKKSGTENREPAIEPAPAAHVPVAKKTAAKKKTK
jgi:AcrR family transcriptional regulator